MPVNQRMQNAENLILEAEMDLVVIAQTLEAHKSSILTIPSDRGVERLNLLLEVSRRLSRVMNLDQLLNIIMDSVISLTRAERGFLMLYEDGILKFKVIRNPGSQNWEGDDYRISHTITQQAIDSGQPLWIKDASHDTNYSQSVSIADLKIRSCMCVPLFTGQAEKQKSLGVIYVDSQQIQESFSAQDLDLFAALAAQAAISIENARLVEDIRLLEKEKRLKLEQENISLQKLLDEKKELLGQCPEMEEVFTMIRRVSGSDASILLLGESGTGKGMAARTIHQLSSRNDKPFVVIDCGAIPENLLESELFGYEKGAFTGAFAKKPGKIELASGGTIFLDEIGDLPQLLQIKLLRVLQEGVIEHIGGRQTIKVDVRVITATNRDLQQEVTEQRFRSDLYYRLNVITIAMPALRMRHNDILLLANAFLERLILKYRKSIVGFSQSAEKAMLDYKWPGNVRELEHRIERAVIMCDDKQIMETHLELKVKSEQGISRGKLKELKHQLEKNLLNQTLSEMEGDISATARQLGITRQQVYRLMSKYSIDPERLDEIKKG
jgi:transcriptional regulator with GAF, ATPase, and Fis domain